MPALAASAVEANECAIDGNAVVITVPSKFSMKYADATISATIALFPRSFSMYGSQGDQAYQAGYQDTRRLYSTVMIRSVRPSTCPCMVSPFFTGPTPSGVPLK